MTTLDQTTGPTDAEALVTLELALHEAEALRTWLLTAEADGATALDDPMVSGVLADLGRAVDAAQAALRIRQEMEQAGLPVGHLSDDEVRDLARRINEAARSGSRD